MKKIKYKLTKRCAHLINLMVLNAKTCLYIHTHLNVYDNNNKNDNLIQYNCVYFIKYYEIYTLLIFYYLDHFLNKNIYWNKLLKYYV